MLCGRLKFVLIFVLQIILICPSDSFSQDGTSDAQISKTCQKILSETVVKVKGKIDQLDPLALDTPTISQGVYDLGRDLKSQSPQFKKLAYLERDLIEQRMSPQAVASEVHKLLEITAEEAEQKLDQLSKTSSSSELRRELEGNRLLLSRGEKLFKRAEYLQTAEGQQELKSMKQEGDDSQKSDDKGQSESKSQSEQSSEQNNSEDSRSSESKSSKSLFSQKHGDKVQAKGSGEVSLDGDASNSSGGSISKSESQSDGETFKGAVPAQVSMILKKTFSDLWIEILRRNASSQRRLDFLVEYSRLARAFHRDHPEMKFLEDAAKRSEKLFEIVEGLQVSYKDSEGFLITQIGKATSDPKELKAFLEIHKRVFEYLKTETALSPEESQAYDRVNDLLKRLELGQASPSENQFAETFLNQLVGPLAKRAMRREFPADSPLGVNTPRLVEAVRANRMNDLLIMARLKSILRISRFETLQALDSWVDRGAKVPISDSSIDYTQSEDLRNRTKIYRDAPLKYDVKRLAAEDLVEQIHRDPILKQDPREKRAKIVDILLYDMSGSMTQEVEGQPDNPKAQMQTYMMASFVDEAQIRVVQGKARHVIYTMPFDGNPKPTETIETLEGAQRYFDSLRQSPLAGNGGTAISVAILKALSLISEHQDGSGELRRANIILFTDGLESGWLQLDAIMNQRQQINKNIPIAFHVVTLGEGNSEMASLASQPERINSLFQYSYQHLSYDEIRQIINPASRMEVLNQLVEISNVNTKNLISSSPILSLKQAFVRLQSKERKDSISLDRRKAILYVLSSSPTEEFSRSAHAAGQVFEPILQILNSTGVRVLLFEAKFKIFSNYLTAATRELEVPEETLLDTLPTSIRMRLREALGFSEDQTAKSNISEPSVRQGRK